MHTYTPKQIREWADRASTMKGFGVSHGDPAWIVVEALRDYADKLEREAEKKKKEG